jgi:hypothetical protein
MTGVTPRDGDPPCTDSRGAAAAMAGWLDLPASFVGVPVKAIGRRGERPAGLVLRRDRSTPGREHPYEITVIDDAGRTLICLGRYAEADVVAVWRGIAATSGLPPMTEDERGRLHRPFPQLGRLRLGAIRVRRGHGLLSGRRPRFLTRRKTARLPRSPVVHREREIIGPRHG